MKRAPQTVKRDEILTVRALFVICTRVTKNALVFSQSEADKVFLVYD